MPEEKLKPEKTLAARQSPRGIQRTAPRFGDILGWPFLHRWAALPSEETWVPAIHVVEKADKFVMKVELAGVKEQDISVSVIGDTLVVEGEKRAESEVKKKGYYYSEASYGSFSRSVSIPSMVDPSRIVANYDKGVLEIDLPKAVEVEAKKIEVNVKKKQAPAARARSKRSSKKGKAGQEKG